MGNLELDQITSAVVTEAKRLSVTLNDEKAISIAAYFDLLGRWNTKIRVAGSSDPITLIQRHLADSLALSKILPDDKPLHCVDVGSGGGLPALPFLVIRPDLELTLVEAHGRKCALLSTALKKMRLSTAQVKNQRLETLRLGHAAHADLPLQDVAWSLATFPPPTWLERAAPLIKSSGLIVVFTTQSTPLDFPGLCECGHFTYDLADGSPRIARLFRPQDRTDSQDPTVRR